LLSAFEERLSEKGFRVLAHHQVPANDGGVSLGQAVVANAQEK
jgi:hydrogenase maturation protein HypF